MSVIIKTDPTPEELAQCAKPQYVNDVVPLTEEQKRNREKAMVRCAQLQQNAMRGFDLSEAVTSGAYEVP